MKYDRLKQILKKKHFKELLKFITGHTTLVEEIHEWDFLRWFYEMEAIF